MARSTTPPFPASSMSTLSVAARDPKRLRPPLLHLVLIRSQPSQQTPKNVTTESLEAESPLLLYALELRTSLLLRGIDVYVQSLTTNAHHSYIDTNPNRRGSIGLMYGGPHNPSVLRRFASMCDLDKVLETSPADSVLVLDEASIHQQNCFVCINGRGLVNVPIEECVEAVLTRWAKCVASELRDHPEAAEIIALNPNLVTDNHLAILIDQLCPLQHLYHKYHQLERLGARYQQWLGGRTLIDISRSSPFAPSLNPSVPGVVSQSHVAYQSKAEDAPTAKAVSLLSQSTKNDIQDKKSTIHGRTTQQDVSQLLKEGMLICLEKGLQEILWRDTWTDSSAQILKGPSSIWLRHSKSIVAQVLSGQLLARDLHRGIIQTCELLSQFPVIVPTSQHTAHSKPFWSSHCLSTESHRQRALRELNTLRSRVEELGAFLSKAPKNKQRGIQLYSIKSPWNVKSPWKAYVTRKREAEGAMRRAMDSVLKRDEWQCPRCTSINTNFGFQCAMCRSKVLRTHDLSPSYMSSADTEYLRNKIRSEIRYASMARQRRQRDRTQILRANQPDNTATLEGRMRNLSLSSESGRTEFASASPPLNSPTVGGASFHSSVLRSRSQKPVAEKIGDTVAHGELSRQSTLLSSSVPRNTSAWLSSQGKNPNAQCFTPHGVAFRSNIAEVEIRQRQNHRTPNMWRADRPYSEGSSGSFSPNQMERRWQSREKIRLAFPPGSVAQNNNTGRIFDFTMSDQRRQMHTVPSASKDMKESLGRYKRF